MCLGLYFINALRISKIYSWWIFNCFYLFLLIHIYLNCFVDSFRGLSCKATLLSVHFTCTLAIIPAASLDENSSLCSLSRLSLNDPSLPLLQVMEAELLPSGCRCPSVIRTPDTSLSKSCIPLRTLFTQRFARSLPSFMWMFTTHKKWANALSVSVKIMSSFTFPFHTVQWCLRSVNSCSTVLLPFVSVAVSFSFMFSLLFTQLTSTFPKALARHKK